MIYLDIGSGERRDGVEWFGVDPYVEDANINAFMWDLPFGDDSVDCIFSSHALEHIEKRMVLPTLKEWYRVIKPDCRVTIWVPNLVWCVKHWLAHQDTGWSMDIIFGNQNHAGEFHKTGFTEQILKNYVTQAGFKIYKFEVLNTHGQETLSIIVYK